MADLTKEPDVATESSQYQAMSPAWTLIADIMAGAGAIRGKGKVYLPQYEDEADSEYKRRVDASPWRPEFTDALRNLASKPFSKEVSLGDTASERVKAIAEDVDGRGNNLTAFSREAFSKGIANGYHAILVDYPTMEPGATVAAERAAGARPYWMQIDARDIIALYTAMQGGKEVVTHVRIRECSVERNGYGERTVDRIRVLEPGRWELWEAQKGADGKIVWMMIDEGLINRGGKTSVPLVLFFTGERKGEMLVKPPLHDLADLQIELYRALSRQDEVLTFAGSPMLAGSGMLPPGDGDPKISVGPKRILIAPPGGDGVTPGWAFIQPDAANITEIRNHVESITDDMRRLGMQPLTQKSGAPTATGQSIEAAKAHSAVQAWALGLKDALEQAMVFTTEWMAEPAVVEIDVSTDFSVAPFAQAPLDALDKARGRKDISQRTYWDGLRRFDVLPPDFDADKEDEALAAETQGLQGEQPIDPVTGRPIDQQGNGMSAGDPNAAGA